VNDQHLAIEAAAESLCIAVTHTRDKNGKRVLLRMPYEEAIKKITKLVEEYKNESKI
jgi:hypothetical protein